jgi:hypothetical protein
MNNKNELTFMKVEEGLEVDWAHINEVGWIDGKRCNPRCK